MFQFRRFPSYAYLIQRRMTGYCPAGLPHSEIPGSMDICSSPKLIAACHVLLRLLMPRHSPCALYSLTFVGTNFVSLASTSRSKLVHAAVPPPPRKPTSLGFARIYGSHELCRHHRSFANWLHCFTLIKVPQHCCFCPLLLALVHLRLHCSVFKVLTFQPLSRSD